MVEKNELAVCELTTPIGPLTLAVYDQQLCHIDFGALRETREALTAWTRRQGLPAGLRESADACRQAADQIRRYFARERKTFDLPLFMKGTPFQKEVWAYLQTIPYGKTCSYKDVAIGIGRPKAVRAVGAANNRNPIPIVVPCHRVVGRDGSLVGYGGGLDKKKWLLGMEKETFSAVHC
ncbi:methylated-DNA--[protein]-cysteine S-methyltransferase [Sporolactobacillus sp. THM7-4]|nr:methylated-DNA--[protein]-cysteine S-methyltransferase [Sporolactobacillus sp. THM7-4]